jgi:hypothetical protein
MSKDATDQTKAAAVFRETVGLLDDGSFDYAVAGGICTDHWTGGAEMIADIDILIREDDTAAILKQLSEAGYETAEMDHSWVHKAFKDGVTVDLMVELKNGTTFDAEFKSHLAKGELFGTVAPVMAAEDQVAALAGTVDRETMKHWYNVIDLMANNDLDWDYVISRAEDVPLKMLSVIYYALSEQVPVQKGVIERLNELVAKAEQ